MLLLLEMVQSPIRTNQLEFTMVIHSWNNEQGGYRVLYFEPNSNGLVLWSSPGSTLIHNGEPQSVDFSEQRAKKIQVDRSFSIQTILPQHWFLFQY